MKAKELLSDASRWCRFSFGMTSGGSDVSPSDPRAVKWCLRGALSLCYSDKEDYKNAVQAVMNTDAYRNKATEWMQKRNTIGYPSLTTVNDTKHTTFADVKAMLEEADV